MTKKDETNRPSISVATVIVKDNQILIGKDARKGESVYGVP